MKNVVGSIYFRKMDSGSKQFVTLPEKGSRMKKFNANVTSVLLTLVPLAMIQMVCMPELLYSYFVATALLVWGGILWYQSKYLSSSPLQSGSRLDVAKICLIFAVGLALLPNTLK